MNLTDDEWKEINSLKRQLALSYMENAALRRQTKTEEDADTQPPAIMEHQPPEIKREYESMRETIAIGREALDLEAAGYDYATALKLSEAVHKGDFETAAKYMEMYENNERTAHAAEIKEAGETAKLRKAFGLR